MKKLSLILLTLLTVFAFCACSGENEEILVTESTTKSESQTSVQTTTQTITETSNQTETQTTITTTEIINTETETTENMIKSTETTTEKKETNSIIIKAGDKSFSAQLYNNKTAQAFADMLPLTINMIELNGNEKYYYMNNPLPSDSSKVGFINNGDIMLYGDDCLVLFYDSFSTSYSYTKIGQIDNPQELADTLGDGDIQIKFYTEE